MNSRAISFVLACAALGLALPAQSFSFPLNSKASYLRTSSDSPAAPLVLDLAGLGLAPGMWLRIGTSGGFRYVSGGQDDFHSLIGVFSASATLLATNVQQRVPDAIAAGPAFPSPNTYFGNQPMDVPQDFYCSRNTYEESAVVQIPDGATHLFLGVHDSYYADNGDPNGDYQALVSVVPTPPLPGTGEHLELRGAVNATPTFSPSLHQAPAGSLMQVELLQPVGFADGATFALFADVFPTGSASGSLLPRLWSDDPIVLLIGTLPSTPGWTLPVQIQVPPGLLGTTLLLQAGAEVPSARNGWYETTTAHRFELQ